ncbi:MAG: Formamidopyrimidine-DNA glycosylase [Acidimicrobiales bacterium]|nr:Formamidopyrimidine-DNA glycosylase [Acidimicrobiales bacterium]
MPELPELQAHAERLDAAFSGAVLADFRPITFTALKTFDPDPATAVGSPLVFVGRRGKYLLLDAGTVTFVVHLMQGGRLRPDEKQSPKPRGGIARWHFDDGRALLLTEPGTERKAGVWVVAGDPEHQAPLEGLGPDADQLDTATLGDLLAAHSVRLHGFLRDQRILAGIGRRLANEICHRAKLSPFANTSKLDRLQVEQLAEALQACINESLAAERGRDELVGSKEREGHVHNRVGEACPVCGDAVRSVQYRAYTVAYCATCQTAGKVLADNTTSKFLK